MKSRKHRIVSIVLSIIMVCLSSTPIAAFDDTVIMNDSHNCSDHVITANYGGTVSPQSLHPSCWAGEHDFTGEVNFEDYHIIHDWNDTGVCKIFYANTAYAAPSARRYSPTVPLTQPHSNGEEHQKPRRSFSTAIAARSAGFSLWESPAGIRKLMGDWTSNHCS